MESSLLVAASVAAVGATVGYLQAVWFVDILDEAS